jgi:hypothetical protein
MIWKVCMETPAGEYYGDVLETAELEEYELLAALRTGVNDAMAWVGGHIEWSSGKPVMKTPIKGDGDWNIRLHPQVRTCPLCEPHKAKAPAAHTPPAPHLVKAPKR